jgi:N-dimethylarginine dimethylaminohydrolase
MAINRHGVGSEYRRLTAVLLYRPGPEIGNYPLPSEIQHLRPIDHAALSREYEQIVRTFNDLGIKVVEIDPSPLSDDRWYRYNMMYCRDLLFMTPRGAILASMAHAVRREEVLYARRALESKGIPLLSAVSGNGTFEGADALWVHDALVTVGVGGRTNREGFEQIRKVLRSMEVECVALPFSSGATQHLLGVVQFIDRDRALVRTANASREIVGFLKDHHITVIGVPENREVRARQAMNVVTISPRTIIMTSACPETKELYLRAGLTIAAEIEIDQLLNGAGGLACATGILGRA